jgi:hypothetical protein
MIWRSDPNSTVLVWVTVVLPGGSRTIPGWVASGYMYILWHGVFHMEERQCGVA